MNLKLAEGQKHLFMVCHLMGLFFSQIIKKCNHSPTTHMGKENSNDFERVGDSLTPRIMSILNYEKSIIYKSKQDILKS